VLLLAGLVLIRTPAFGQEQMDATVHDRSITVERDELAGIDRMSGAMTSMAEMCQTMVKQEMEGRPAKMAALWALGTLGTVVLVFLAILEIQWIRLCNVRIR